MRILYLLLLSSFGFDSIAISNPQYAWWMNAHIDTSCSSDQPGTVSFDGVCYVLLSREVLSRIPGYEQEDLADTGAKFQIAFPKGRGHEYYATAVYKSAQGKTGRALIVSLNPNFTEIARVETREGIPGFSALFIDKGKLIWSFCLYCGDYVPVATNP